jgi:hypothetical protein
MKELNMITNTKSGPGITTHMFADFLREPDQLNHCKVLVWITTEGHMPFLKPLPPEIAAYAAGNGSRTDGHASP